LCVVAKLADNLAVLDWSAVTAAIQATPWLLLAGTALLWCAMFKPLDINVAIKDALEHWRWLSQRGKPPEPAPKQTNSPKSESTTQPKKRRAKKA
jgi:hypothetical protein